MKMKTSLKVAEKWARAPVRLRDSRLSADASMDRSRIEVWFLRPRITQCCFRPEGVEIPFEVLGHPGPQPETRFAVGSISPRRGHLGNPIALQKSLNGKLEIEFETSLALDRK